MKSKGEAVMYPTGIHCNEIYYHIVYKGFFFIKFSKECTLFPFYLYFKIHNLNTHIIIKLNPTVLAYVASKDMSTSSDDPRQVC